METEGELRGARRGEWLGSEGWKWRCAEGTEVGVYRGRTCIGVLAGKWGEVEVPPLAGPYLVQDVLVEVGHVPLAGHGTIVIISEVLLQSHRVMGDVQDRVQVMGQHLRQKGS